MKTNGLTYKAFLNDQSYWGKDTYYDDVLVWIDGEELTSDTDPKTISDTAKVVIETGFIMSHEKKADGTSLTSFFKGWLKTQDSTAKLVMVSTEKEVEFKDLMKQHGFKVM